MTCNSYLAIPASSAAQTQKPIITKPVPQEYHAKLEQRLKELAISTSSSSSNCNMSTKHRPGHKRNKSTISISMFPSHNMNSKGLGIMVPAASQMQQVLIAIPSPLRTPGFRRASISTPISATFAVEIRVEDWDAKRI